MPVTLRMNFTVFQFQAWYSRYLYV